MKVNSKKYGMYSNNTSKAVTGFYSQLDEEHHHSDCVSFGLNEKDIHGYIHCEHCSVLIGNVKSHDEDHIDCCIIL